MTPASQETIEQGAKRKVARIVAQWSIPDRAQWVVLYPTLFNKRSVAYDPSRPPSWIRRSNIAHILSRFHVFIAEEFSELADRPFAERVTPETMLLWADWMGETLSDGSISDHILDVCRYAKACDPSVSLRLIRLEARRYGRSRRCQEKRRLALCAHELFSKTNVRLDAIEAKLASDVIHDDKTRRNLAESYRNLIQIAFLLRLPIRLRNLQSLDLAHFPGSDLSARISGERKCYQADDAPLHVTFKAAEMKNRQPYRTKIPGALARRIRYYAEHIRHDLAQTIDAEMTRLWIAPSGAGESAIGIHQCIVRMTSNVLGIARLTVHDFRHIVASTAAADGIPRAQIAMLLQQTPDSRTVERYISSWSDAPLRENRGAVEATLLALVAKDASFSRLMGQASSAAYVDD